MKKLYVKIIVILIVLCFVLTGCDNSLWYKIKRNDKYDLNLSSMGYYFESYEEAISYFEGEYNSTDKERDLVDLSICLVLEDTYKDKKYTYYPKLIKLVKDSSKKVVGLNPENLKNIYADYAYIVYQKSKQNGKIILEEYSGSIEEKVECYDAFFALLGEDYELWETEDFNFAYEIYKDLSEESKYSNDGIYQQNRVLVRLCYFTDKAGHSNEAEEYKKEISENIEYIQNNENEFINDMKVDRVLEHGYYFEDIDHAISYFINEYTNSKDKRTLVDLCICLSMSLEYKSEKEYYYPILFKIIESKGNINGLSQNDLDSIYCGYVFLYENDINKYKSEFFKYGKRANNKARYIAILMSNSIFFGKKDIAVLSFLNEQGEEYIQYLEQEDEAFNEKKKSDIDTLKQYMEFVKYIIDYYNINEVYPEVRTIGGIELN